jgi:Predicted phosphohydrolase (DHH superfamily)
MSKVLITHNDFDGVTCAILFKIIHPNGTYYLENYDTVDNRIKQVLEERPDFLYITDISPQSEEVIELLNKFGNVRLFDHHKTALHLNNLPWATVDTTKCGAYLFYEYLLSFPKTEPLTMWRELVFCANDYDLWLHFDPHSKVLNLLEVYPVDIAVIINAQKGTVSFRSKEADVSDLAKALGGGGHPRAAGCTLPKHLFHDEIANLLAEVMTI